MNALIYAINEINNTIPYEILYAGFTISETAESINMTSLDDKILRKLLRKRVLIDANIVGGIEAIIPLNSIPPSYYEQFYTVYNILPELTMNKEIISALNITMIPGNGLFTGNGQATFDNFNNGQGNALTNVANRIGNAAAPSGVLSNAHIEIVGYNTILIYANYRTLMNSGLRVVLENESNLNNIQPRSYKAFSLLCVLAAKAYIYNKLIVAINSGYLSSGQDLGVFKSIIESYSDAEEQYRTYLTERIGAVLFLNDVVRTNRYIGSMISPDL